MKIISVYATSEEKTYIKKHKTFNSAYEKKELSGEVYINKMGLELDTQADKLDHGGIDKAVCVYPRAYYKFLEDKHDISLKECAFGENLSVEGLDDSEVCLGDRYQNGEVVFEVSQPRQPCWKMANVIGIKKLAAIVVQESKTGFYLRVIKEGILDKANDFELISRVNEGISIEFINNAYFNAKNSQDQIKQILQCPELSPAYKKDLEKRYKFKEVGLQQWQHDDY